ncbi:bifunctional glutamate--cysteine ligase GshA/glutathione synthetase GshB [Avibacterium paragallinarum]|uniref:bifunctional glutamate--cysteine ligase GshA/glutathione synthetase GshB n=1 Tax=Avibacterium paragallinarum TaxID=728 RepID=UPI00021AD500|nr:bifunctional glutamate--cysteine ligase GshA/glutathione synthetase GshB [Avibacterium paragallinarum]QIR12420.1 bifunctional glutamate--cysteine ligase GshA/glutathione synthetase GshB [Avibacterium paragallinarum]QJE10626.1 bifunctional glutamate--cysteine ligase GshA/glutathione synthetase GshB [Avibacterium paragallinarum]QJE12820.1 bifunctional glutamate--cysteine ligase GshA/glutathione synthetase GshB [Avibacterium paragallinarum]QJE15021.1 bifunctional glutamate--cysteine ligase GshA
MKIQQTIKQNHLGLLFQQGSFGIEKESQRVHADGSIVTTEHPKVFGNRSYHPYIQTDFAESQVEMITPPQHKLEDSLRWLSAIHQVVLRSIPEDEYLFPLSMPAGLPPEDQIQVAQLDNAEDVAYREHLVKSYGKNKQMVSGIHYNFQLDPELVQTLFKAQSEYQSAVQFQNDLYLKMAKNFLRYQWVLLYLLAATPTVQDNYFKQGNPLKAGQYVRSLRSSQYGYVNAPEIKVSFDSIEQYVESLEHWVNSGKLIAEKEFYSNVRLRGAKKARELLNNGIQYLEFRLFDLNPFDQYGITLSDAKFIHYFVLLMIWLDETVDQNGVELGKARLAEVALENPLAPTQYRQEGEALLHQLLAMLEEIHAPQEISEIVQQKLQQFADPALTLGGRLVQAIEKAGDYQKLGAALAQQYKANAFERFYALEAFDNMELSTQALLFDLIQKGIKTEILDEQDQFLCLQVGDHIEYVKNGNMTSKDSYISPLIMENKVVTKKVLHKAGFNVPQSLEFTSAEQAIANYGLFEGCAVVIKPKSTNYGLGITIFQQGVSNREDFAKAIEIAFREDKEVMVEDYLSGTEYRFFVLGDETLAVLLRVPANVVGDGKHSVAELVAAKNDHPLRGDGSRTPLKKIALGDIEKLQLKEQGLTVDSIPEAGRIVQLRANSNISTGGDSIDMTDEMHPSYKALAVGITKAMGAAVCGVDLIIPDLHKPAEPSLQSWGVIEANFNPMMMMHIFPYSGKSRRLTLNVIKMLFPELPH